MLGRLGVWGKMAVPPCDHTQGWRFCHRSGGAVSTEEQTEVSMGQTGAGAHHLLLAIYTDCLPSPNLSSKWNTEEIYLDFIDVDN